MKFNLNALSLLLSGLILTPAVNAVPRWFEVEVILFERVGEETKEDFTDIIKQYNLDKALRLQDNLVYGSLQPCPTLTQFERFSVTSQRAKENITDINQDIALDSVIDVTDIEIETTPLVNVNDVVPAVIECIVPNDDLLRQAYDISAKRLSDIAASNQLTTPDNSETAQSLSQQLTGNVTTDNDGINIVESSGEISDKQTAEQFSQDNTDIPQPPAYDSNTFVDYPKEFSFNGVEYRSVPKPIIPNKVPLRIAASNQVEFIHTPDVPYLLNEEHLQMTTLVQKLRWQKTSTSLLHIGWRQPMVARHLSVPIHLFAGKDYSEEFDEEGNNRAFILESDALQQEAIDNLDNQSLSENSTESNDNIYDLATPKIAISDILTELKNKQAPTSDAKLWQLDGLLNIYLNHYLFIEADFDLRKVEQVKVITKEEIQETQVPTNQSISLLKTLNISEDDVNTEIATESEFSYVSQLTSHPMKQHRRVRSKEIHYFDHPSMGMIIQIRRFKIPEPALEQPQTIETTSVE